MYVEKFMGLSMLSNKLLDKILKYFYQINI